MTGWNRGNGSCMFLFWPHGSDSYIKHAHVYPDESPSPFRLLECVRNIDLFGARHWGPSTQSAAERHGTHATRVRLKVAHVAASTAAEFATGVDHISGNSRHS